MEYSNESEKAVLEAAILSPDLRNDILLRLGAEDFWDNRNRLIFRAVADIDESGAEPDLGTILNYMQERHPKRDAWGGVHYLTDLFEPLTSAENIHQHIQTVKELSVKRQFDLLIRTLKGELKSLPHEEINDFLSQAEHKIMKLGDSGEVDAPQLVGDFTEEILEQIEMMCERGQHVLGTSTGFSKLDNQLTGLHDSELIIVAARPSVGKTALALNMAEHMAEHGKRVAIFSLEMSKPQLSQRMLSTISGVNLHKVANGYLSEHSKSKLRAASQKMQSYNLFIDDQASITPTALRTKARRLYKKTGLDVIFVDYLQLMRCYSNADRREREIAEISGALKALAKELKIPIVALSQLNRRSEVQRSRPRLSDLRESGAIEQDADVVLFLHRMESEPDSMDPNHSVDVIIGKQRNGPTGIIKMAFDPSTTKFFERSMEEAVPF